MDNKLPEFEFNKSVDSEKAEVKLAKHKLKELKKEVKAKRLELRGKTLDDFKDMSDYYKDEEQTVDENDTECDGLEI